MIDGSIVRVREIGETTFDLIERTALGRERTHRVTGYDPVCPEAGCDACSDTPGRLYKNNDETSGIYEECICQFIQHASDPEDDAYDAHKERDLDL